jgi:hypothetical protein
MHGLFYVMYGFQQQEERSAVKTVVGNGIF